MLELFRHYPRLAERLPHVSLGEFPTPVDKVQQFPEIAGLRGLYIKRDDLTGAAYGGNKVRKLEFLLAAALRRGARRVITFGYAGSNHALATSIYARQLGLQPVSMLVPQANAPYIRTNLLAGLHVQAEFHAFRGWRSLSLGLPRQCIRGLRLDGRLPAVIPGGGSCAPGIVGYVNAAFELQAQIESGILPEPDCIYVAMGSMGTAAGLLVGLRAAGLKTRVVPVRVIESALAPPSTFLRYLRQTAGLLHKSDAGFPALTFSAQDVQIRDDCLGPGYARGTQASAEAGALLRERCGVPANGTYTAKAFSALLKDARAGTLDHKVVLFWNTFNSRDLSPLVAGSDYRALPRAFHRYFESDTA
jgi:1-aminocyclopropane-1-carboxylate deaminase/D-cysteine desulfhydrase-like pyridoxal-dependent ACC family enzyme